MAIDWEHYGRERMASDTRGQSSTYHAQTYIDGNTVRRLAPNANALPKRRERVEPKREPQRSPQRMPVKMPGISGRAFVFLLAMLGLVVFMGFSFLTTQGEVRQQKAEVIALQTQIAVEREEYDEAYQAIVDSVDLAEIYERATADLKMVRAKNSQIYTYTNKKSDMVRQYADIPGAE